MGFFEGSFGNLWPQSETQSTVTSAHAESWMGGKEARFMMEFCSGQDNESQAAVMWLTLTSDLGLDLQSFNYNVFIFRCFDSFL